MLGELPFLFLEKDLRKNMEFIDLKSAVRIFCLSKTTLRSLVRNGRLRSYRLSKTGKYFLSPRI